MGRHRAGDGVRAPWQEGAREALTAVGLDPGAVRDYAIRTIAEDLGPGWVDVTAAVTVPIEDERRAGLVGHEDGGVARVLLLPGLLPGAAPPPHPPGPTAGLPGVGGAPGGGGGVLAGLRGRTRRRL